MEMIWPVVFMLSEAAVYYAGGCLLFRQLRSMRYPLIIGGSVLFFCILFIPNAEMAIAPVLIRSYILILMLYALPGKNLYDRAARLVVLFFIICCMEGVAESIMELLPFGDHTYGRRITESGVVLLFLLLILWLQSNHEEQKRNRMIVLLKRGLFPISILFAVGVTATASLLKYAAMYVPKPGFQEIADALAFLANIGIGILGVLLIYIKTSNEKMERTLDLEQHIMKMQKHYYEDLLSREKDTRRYRHDMSNHLLCMRGYADRDDWSALKQYIDTLQGEMEYINKQIYHTGNQVLDILINHYAGILPSETDIQVTGMLSLEADERKLCTVFGNLLQNAAEELLHCGRGAYLQVRLEQGTKFVRISIENSKAGKKDSSSQVVVSKMGGQIKHYGFGLHNVRETLEEMSGILTVTEDDECYTAEVVFPLHK